MRQLGNPLCSLPLVVHEDSHSVAAGEGPLPFLVHLRFGSYSDSNAMNFFLDLRQTTSHFRSEVEKRCSFTFIENERSESDKKVEGFMAMSRSSTPRNQTDHEFLLSRSYGQLK